MVAQTAILTGMFEEMMHRKSEITHFTNGTVGQQKRGGQGQSRAALHCNLGSTGNQSTPHFQKTVLSSVWKATSHPLHPEFQKWHVTKDGLLLNRDELKDGCFTYI